MHDTLPELDGQTARRTGGIRTTRSRARATALALGIAAAVGLIGCQPAPRSTVPAGGRMAPDTTITSPDGRFRAHMQPDGNLTVIAPGEKPVWATGTSGNPGASLEMQGGDGNLVVYSAAGRALWAAGTGGNPGAFLDMQDDGNLVVYTSDRRALWSRGGGRTGNSISVAAAGSTLRDGNFLITADKRFKLQMQGDNNLVLLQDGTPVWSTGTGSRTGGRTEMQGDGNLVVYDAAGRAIWNSGTAGNPGARLIVQGDGNVVVQNGAQPLWSRFTGRIVPGSSKVDEFVARWNGRCADFDGYYGAQCVDVFSYYNRDVVGAARYPVPLAHQIWGSYDTSKYVRVAASSAPRKGDVAIWGTSWGAGAGHVGIVLADVNGSTMQVLDQNNPTGSCTRVHNVSKSGLLGYLRPTNL